MPKLTITGRFALVKQLSLIKASSLECGGKCGHAKRARPLCTKRPIHLVVKSSIAKGPRSFYKFKPQISAIVQKQAKKFGVRIYYFANAGNHLHMIVRPQSHTLFKNFLRAISGLIARLITRAEKGRPWSSRHAKFWDARPYTRIAAWGKAYEYLKSYVTLNKLEALGFFAYQNRSVKKRKLYSVRCEPLKMQERITTCVGS